MMGIIQKYIDVVIRDNQREYYESKGYIVPKVIRNEHGRVFKGSFSKTRIKVSDLISGSAYKVECRCEICKETRFVMYSDLMRSKKFLEDKTTICVKCSNITRNKKNIKKRTKTGRAVPLGERFSNYKCRAKRKGISFNLTIDEFKDITSSQCYYCAGFSREEYNGIDRLNPLEGYELDNCVPCCSICNCMKSDLGFLDFIKHIQKIYKNKGEPNGI